MFILKCHWTCQMLCKIAIHSKHKPGHRKAQTLFCLVAVLPRGLYFYHSAILVGLSKRTSAKNTTNSVTVLLWGEK